MRRSAVLVALVVVAAGPVLSARAGGPQTATASPNADLIDGEYVLVSWSGFPAGGAVFLRQCAANPASLAQCVPERNANGQPSSIEGFTGQDGAGKVYVPVAYGSLPGGVTCTSAIPCSIGVFNDPKDVSTAVFAPIAFEFPPSACPAPKGTTIFGSGASSAFRAMLQWEGSVCRPPYELSVEYTLKNSVDGMKDFVSKLTDFTATSIPFSPTQATVLKHAGRSFGYAPLALSSLTFAYRLFDRQTGQQITDLRLTPQILAELFTGQINNWNDPSITALNPGHQFPSIVHTIARADNCAATWEMTSWFDAVAKEAYEAGGPAFQGGPTRIYPDTGQIDLATGAQAVALGVAKPAQDSDPTTFGFIGVVDSSFARLYGLPTVKIKNLGGQFVGPTNDAVLAAVDDAAASGSAGFVQPSYTNSDPTAYPLPTMTYVVAPTSKVESGVAAALRGFLRYTAGAGQSALPPGYVPLPGDLVALTRKVASEIPGDHPSKNRGGGRQEGGPGAGSGGGYGSNQGSISGGLGSASSGISSVSGGPGGVVAAGVQGPASVQSSSGRGPRSVGASGPVLGQYLVRTPIPSSGPALLVVVIVLCITGLATGPMVLLSGLARGRLRRVAGFLRHPSWRRHR
jgi:ABC-type phosphate transport system substrate-binding protein